MGLGGMPPKAAKKPKKGKKPKAEGKGGKKKKKRTESYSIYIYKVLEQGRGHSRLYIERGR